MSGLSFSYILTTYIKIFSQLFFLLWPMWLLIGITLLGRFVFYMIERQKLKKSGISEIDKMDGKTFEKRLQILFQNLGYKVERTRYIGDYGADLIIFAGGAKTVIQAKRYKKNVGLKAVQEAVAAKGYYKCDRAMVVSNSYYTNQAIQLAKSNEVQLWNRKDLINALIRAQKSNPVQN